MQALCNIFPLTPDRADNATDVQTKSMTICWLWSMNSMAELKFQRSNFQVPIIVIFIPGAIFMLSFIFFRLLSCSYRYARQFQTPPLFSNTAVPHFALILLSHLMFFCCTFTLLKTFFWAGDGENGQIPRKNGFRSSDPDSFGQKTARLRVPDKVHFWLRSELSRYYPRSRQGLSFLSLYWR